MPGNVDLVASGIVHGWARHPVHAAYPMTVHAIEAGIVTATVLAEIAREDGMPGFALPCRNPARLGILLGETDEWLAVPDPPPVPSMLTVEHLIAVAQPRPWVCGACHIDALAAGLRPETIVDLLCRDHLGRPAGPVITATAMARAPRERFDATRRLLLAASEYQLRRVHADRAPGAIFSQRLVQAAAPGDFTLASQTDPTIITVPAAPLLDLDREEFITGCYRQILRKEPDREGMAHYLAILANGQNKAAIIRHLAQELEAISAGILVTGLD